jgi:hypothetical protein
LAIPLFLGVGLNAESLTPLMFPAMMDCFYAKPWYSTAKKLI